MNIILLLLLHISVCQPPKWIFFTAQQTAKLHMWIVECFCGKTHSFPNMWILGTICHSLIINDLDGFCIVFDTKKTLAELCGTDGVDTITHGDDGIKLIEQRVAPNLSCTFLFPDDFPQKVSSFCKIKSRYKGILTIPSSSFLEYGNILVRKDSRGIYLCLYTFRLLAFIVSPALHSIGNISIPSDIRKSTSASDDDVQ